MLDLSSHYLKGASKFLQTAIVIDDQAEFSGAAPVAPKPPLKAPISSIIKRSAAAVPVPGSDQLATAVTDPENRTAQIAKQDDVVIVDAPPPAEEPSLGPDGTLDAKTLSEAFLAKNMICGLYRPQPDDNMVAKTAGAAKSADIVVVDWHLQPGSSLAAKSIIKSVLESDVAEQGRLRLIAVYTSQPGRADMAADLLADIQAQPALTGRLEADGPVLFSKDTRIVFLNKPGTAPSVDLEAVSEADLPTRLVLEFAKLSDGLLGTFAISAVAAIRRGVHHVLALYGEDLDGAYVAHRCALPHPDDAVAFGTDLLASELRNLIDLDDAANANLNSEVIEAWLADLTQKNHVFKTSHAVLPADEVAKFVKGGLAAVKASKDKQRRPDDPQAEPGKDRKITPGLLPLIFYSDSQAATDATQSLARLSTFQREKADRARFPTHWKPTLTLGSVIQAWPVNAAPELLLCVQPKCDSVRLKVPTAFPFQTISLQDPNFNLALKDATGVPHYAWVNLKPRDALMIRFQRNESSETVQAADEEGQMIFTDEDGRKFVWLGDLKEMKAQKWAGDLGHRVLGVGLDDLEWLRTASEREITRNWA